MRRPDSITAHRGLRSKIICASFLSFFLFCPCFNSRASGPGPCGGGSGLIVDTARHLLFICQDGDDIQQYRVSIGRGGTDKRKHNDDKTPLGAYPLGIPRPSARFGTFIPIIYPTPRQKATGYSGNDVGVHGPFRQLKSFGEMNTSADWTRGCVAVGSDEEISEIARWLKEHQASRILIK